MEIKMATRWRQKDDNKKERKRDDKMVIKMVKKLWRGNKMAK